MDIVQFLIASFFFAFLSKTIFLHFTILNLLVLLKQWKGHSLEKVSQASPVVDKADH